jgi:hypothetical protein
MGNLRQKYTSEEWANFENGCPDESLLINIIPNEGEPDVISEIIDSSPDQSYYGGKENLYEVIKIINAWELGYEFSIANVIKYVLRAGKKTSNPIKDLNKAKYYIENAIKLCKDGNKNNTP